MRRKSLSIAGDFVPGLPCEATKENDMSLQHPKKGKNSKSVTKHLLTSATRKSAVGVAILTLVLVLCSRYASHVFGASTPRVLITTRIDESQLVRLAGNTRPEANAKNDRGREPDDFPVDHMLLQLKRDPRLEQEFAAYIETLTDKNSPNFRHWMTADEQGEKYGVAQQDVDTITGWLQSHGFSVGYVYPNHMVIDFSGTAGQIRQAFHTEIHALEVRNEQHFANMTDPQIPAALAPVVEGVVSMHNFLPHATHDAAQYSYAGCNFGECLSLVPADLQTVYNVTPLLKAGITGKGMKIVVVEDSNSYSDDWSVYQSKFDLKSYGGTLSTVHPNDAGNCTNPGTNGSDVEADLDVEMVTAIAPAAEVELASCKDGETFATFGALLAIENILSADSPPPIISMSYGFCEVVSGATANAAFYSTFQSAAAAGVSVFVSAGDNGPTFCSRDITDGSDYALTGIGVTGWGETPYNVSVGGTDFEDVYFDLKAGYPITNYWSVTNNATTFGSAKTYIPEIPWNSSCASYLFYSLEGYSVPYGTSGFCNSSTGEGFLSTAAGSGGASNCAKGAGNTTYAYVEGTNCTGYPKPGWQQGIFGNPADGVRDIPDVSLFAANGLWGHFLTICASDTTNGGKACTGAPSGWDGIGGTSAAAPMMAAIQALVDEKWGIRAGNPNPTYYSIAKGEYGTTGKLSCYSDEQTPGATSSCVFYDITAGDNNVDCRYNGTHFHADCYTPSGTNGALSTQAISSISLAAAGSGYTSTPTCTINVPSNKAKYVAPTGTVIYDGGTQATCKTTINATTKVVTAVSLTNKGEGYTGVPICTIAGGGGTGAKCKLTITPTVGATAYQPAYGATPGWDMATGIGSVNAYNLVFDSAW
jgi:subtilase family serine protease